jgi:hypothetical protein
MLVQFRSPETSPRKRRHRLFTRVSALQHLDPQGPPSDPQVDYLHRTVIVVLLFGLLRLQHVQLDILPVQERISWEMNSVDFRSRAEHGRHTCSHIAILLPSPPASSAFLSGLAIATLMTRP